MHPALPETIQLNSGHQQNIEDFSTHPLLPYGYVFGHPLHTSYKTVGIWDARA
ncbi:hypothetical protein HispidOSU_007313, partial [Sigmodon hispidus]